jgi:peptidoglycan hydrolase-like protein with peptidoglycan-binding domain
MKTKTKIIIGVVAIAVISGIVFFLQRRKKTAAAFAELDKSIEQGYVSAPASSSSTSSTLKKGSKGDAVKTLQTKLSKLGYKVGTIDGIFGTNTETAVKAFQKAKNLTVDGIAGPMTLNALK